MSKTASTALLKAVFNGHIAGAANALTNGADPNHRDPFGRYPILAASHQCDHAMITLLMKHGANPRCLGADEMYPMAIASVMDRTDVMNALGAHCWDAEPPSALIPSALEHALLAGRDQAARHLINHGADMQAPGRSGDTLLMRMTTLNNEFAVRLLLQEGALWFSQDADQRSALDCASALPDRKLLQLLLHHANSQPLLGIKAFLPRRLFFTTRRQLQPSTSTRHDDQAPSDDVATTSPESPSIVGSSHCSSWVTRQVIRFLNELYWLTPVNWKAAHHTRSIIAQLKKGNLHSAWLLSRDPHFLPNARDLNGTPLTLLVCQSLHLPDTSLPEERLLCEQPDRATIAANLLRHFALCGAHTHIIDSQHGHTIAHALLEGPWAGLYRKLLSDKLYLNTLNRSNTRLNRPLHIATQRRDTATIESLMSHGCDRNPVNRDGHTPLHNCAVHADSEVAGLLINSGANFQLRTRRGQSIEAIIKGLGARVQTFEALLHAREGIDKIMSIFSSNHPLSASVRLQQHKPTPKPDLS